MKHWRNSWEQFVGKKLQDAEVTPESHIWDLIEQELDAQDGVVEQKRRNYKTAAAIAALLLLAGSFMISNTPKGEAGIGLNFHQPKYAQNQVYILKEDSKSNITVSDFYNAETVAKKLKASAQHQVASLHADFIPTTTTHINEDLDGSSTVNNLRSDAVNSIKSSVHSIPEEVLSEASAMVNSRNTALYSSIEIISSKKLDAKGLNVIKSDLIPLKDDLWKLKFNPLTRLDNDYQLPNSLVVPKSSSTALVAVVAVAKLPKQPALLMPSELSLNELQVPNIDWTLTDVPDVELADASKKDWISEADAAFDDWKATIAKDAVAATSEMEEEIEEDIIDEAILEEDDPLTQIKEAEEYAYHKKRNINKGFHIGLVSSFQNTWVVRKSRNAEINRDQVQYKFTPGYQIGINAGYDFAKHIGVMAEIKYSNEGAKYYNPVKERNEHLDLTYIDIPVYLKFKHSKPTARKIPIMFNYLIGANFRDMRSVTTSVDGEERRFGQDYNTSEWGLTAGFDFDIYAKRNLFFTVGVRGGVSVLSKGFPKLKDERGTMSYNLGVFTRINFRKPGK